MSDKKLSDTLNRLHDAFTSYVVFPNPESADATVLWTAASHAQPAWEIATRLHVRAPEKQCGKTRVLEIVQDTSHKPMATMNTTVAALARSISLTDPLTLIVDEADAIWKGKKGQSDHEELRAILNAGHNRLARVLRWNQMSRKLEELPVFAMVALASIGDLPDTIEDRSVIIRMRRRAPGEEVKGYRSRRDGVPLRKLGKELHERVRAHVNLLHEIEPSMPVDDRDADNWSSLMAIAEIAGERWSERAWTACETLCAQREALDEQALGVRLLSDLRAIFREAGVTRGMWTEKIIVKLLSIPEAPWADLGYGKVLDDRDLAAYLRRYEVKSKDVKIKGKVKKGYRALDLADPWSRYLPQE